MATEIPSLSPEAARQLISQLRDIHGLDPLSWWPPAPGWWLLAFSLLLLIWLAWRYRASLRLRIPPIPVLRIGSWRWDAARQLRALRQRATTQDPKQTAAELSELLRRIAMARLGRDACAGLTGEAWLAWLTERDPKQFDWRSRGRPLLIAPYAPPLPHLAATRAASLKEAARGASAPQPPRQGRRGQSPGPDRPRPAHRHPLLAGTDRCRLRLGPGGG